jgi:GNAT superfamily N-acetyltransferase
MQPVPAPASPPWLVTTGQQAPQAVERLLRSLPEWFGIESSIVYYVASAAKLPTYLAWPAADQDAPRTEHHAVGALLAARHFPAAAEIYLMAVDRAVHRRGVGRAMVAAVERDLARDGVRLLQVKTLGPSDPDAGYRQTLLFYPAMGFEPLEEITGLWPDNPSLIMVKTLALPGNIEGAIDAGHDRDVQRGEHPRQQVEVGQARLGVRSLRVHRA